MATLAITGSTGNVGGRVYDLTEPQDLGLAEATAVLAERRSTPVTYRDETVEEAYASRASDGVRDWQLVGWVSTYTSIGAGEMARSPTPCPRLTGHPARSLRDGLSP